MPYTEVDMKEIRYEILSVSRGCYGGWKVTVNIAGTIDTFHYLGYTREEALQMAKRDCDLAIKDLFRQ